MAPEFPRAFLYFVVMALLTVAGRAAPIMTEFMAENDSTLADEDGDFSDWIEIHNPGLAPVDLDGWYLTDRAEDLRRWMFPAVSIAPGEFVVVYASGKNRTTAGSPLHTDFRLANEGEYLALVEPDGTTIGQEFAPAYPAQGADRSYGLGAEGPAFFDTPTPGAPNAGPSEPPGVADTKFSPNRGFYDVPIKVTITTATPGATIRYTTDGSTPTATSGRVYSQPVSVNQTTVLRAAAFKRGLDPTNVDTHSYFFLEDVVRQSEAAPRGWPSWSANGQVFNYGMDPEIVNHPDRRIGGIPRVISALRAIPSISLVTDQANLTDPATGIYTNPGGDGRDWERESHIELLFPPGYVDVDGNTGGFASPAGLRIRGGFSRSKENPKHSFRLFFRGEYGNGRLNYRLFGKEGADEFDKFDLRTAQNYSWAFGGDGRNTFLRDIWSRDTQLAMGRPATRGRFYHLYLNGLYWGLYQTDERAEAAYGETYFGGNQWDYDVVKTRGELTDGTYDSWRRLWQKWSAGFSSNEAYFNVLGRNPNGSRNRDYEHLLDPGNLVDYMIILYYSGDSDGPPNNYFSIYNRTHPDGWKFFEHDSEHSLDRGRFDMVNTPASGWSLAEFHPRLLHQGLMENEEYRMLFADHVARHCLNGGVLTEAESLARMDRRVRQIDRAIMANSARWGDSKREPALTRLDWLSAVSAQRSFFRSRSSILIAQLRSAGWYPTPEPPVFSRHGGLIGSAEELQVTGRSGTVYATVNGHDPRIIGGAIRSTARRVVGPLSLTTAGPNVVRARVLDGTEWSALTSATFLVDTDPASASNLAISEIHYRPAAPSPQEIAAGYDERSAFEFIELLNTGSRFIDLAGVRLSEGVRFDFEETNRYRSLSPGGRVLIVNDAEAFGLRYRGRLPIAGEFTGSLNNDGERLLVQSPGGDPVADVTFNDAGAWPREADGGGYSLVRIDATRAEGDPANWRASSEVGGNPGGTDSLDYHSWLQSHGLEDNEEDRDADGLSPFLEYVLGGSPMVADAEVVLPKARIETVEVGAGSDDYLVLHVRRRVGADDARFEAEWSPDLVSWQRDSVFLGAEDNGDGTETLRFRAPRPHNEGKAQFLRVHTSR